MTESSGQPEVAHVDNIPPAVNGETFPIAPTLLLLGASVLANMIGAIIVVFAALGLKIVDLQAFFADPIPLAVTAQAIGYIPAVGVLVWWMRPATRVAWSEIGLRRPKVMDVVLGAGAGVVSVLIVSCIGLGIKTMTGMKVEDGSKLLGHHPGGPQFLMLAVLAVLGAPIIEEMVFRGIIFNALRTRTGMIASTIVSAGLFSAMHLSVVNFIPLMMVGAVFAIAYTRTKNLWTSMTAHAVFNGIGVAGVLLQHS